LTKAALIPVWIIDTVVMSAAKPIPQKMRFAIPNILKFSGVFMPHLHRGIEMRGAAL